MKNYTHRKKLIRKKWELRQGFSSRTLAFSLDQLCNYFNNFLSVLGNIFQGKIKSTESLECKMLWMNEWMNEMGF